MPKRAAKWVIRRDHRLYVNRANFPFSHGTWTTQIELAEKFPTKRDAQARISLFATEGVSVDGCEIVRVVLRGGFAHIDPEPS